MKVSYLFPSPMNLAALAALEPDPTRALAVRYNKADKQWISTVVLAPTSKTTDTLKGIICCQMLCTMGPCCHCPRQATFFSNIFMRDIETTTKDTLLTMLVADHCNTLKCTASATTLVNARAKEETKEPNTAGFYRCETCKQFFTKVLKCSRCHMSQYCGAVCQKKDWAAHKQRCVILFPV